VFDENDVNNELSQALLGGLGPLDRNGLTIKDNSGEIVVSERTAATTVSCDGDSVTTNGADYTPVLDPRRFVVLSVFSLANVLAGAAWITFAPIDDVVMEKYHVTDQQVNWLSLIFMALYGPGTILCAWFIRKYGLRATVVVSAVLMALGGMIRWWSVWFVATNDKSAYPVLLAGQALVAMGQPVFSNAPARVASAWFQQTTVAISFVVFGSMLGMVLGQAMSPWLVHQFDWLLAGQGLAMLVCAIATYFCFESEPNQPPTTAEAVRRRSSLVQESDNASTCSTSAAWLDLKKLSTDKQYVVLLLATGIEFGVNNALLTLLQPWIASTGFPSDVLAGACGTFCIVGGVVGIFIAAPTLEKTRNYKQAVRWSFVVTFVTMVGVVAVLQPKSHDWMLLAAFFVMGMTQFPILPICMDAAAAHTYPISEELSSAGMQIVGQYLGILLTDAMEPLVRLHSRKDEEHEFRGGFASPVNIATLALLFVSAVTASCYNGEDKRADANINHHGDVPNRTPDEEEAS
jgi:MFS family permease